MPCNLIQTLRSCVDALLAVRDECCPELAGIQRSDCVTDMVRELSERGSALVENPACSKRVLESVPKPAWNDCLSGTYLAGLLAWLQGLRCDGEPACPEPWVWSFEAENGATWTQLEESRVRIGFEDSLNCGGTNEAIQGGVATTCAIAPYDGCLAITATGNVETHSTGYDRITITVNDVEVLTQASINEGGDCAMEQITVSANFDVAAGDVVNIRVGASTIDWLFHVGAYWDVKFEFKPTEDCQAQENACGDCTFPTSVSVTLTKETGATPHYPCAMGTFVVPRVILRENPDCFVRYEGTHSVGGQGFYVVVSYSSSWSIQIVCDGYSYTWSGPSTCSPSGVYVPGTPGLVVGITLNIA